MKQQCILAFVKTFPDHLIGARALSTRTQHRAFDCFISLNFLLALYLGQDRNLNWGEVKVTNDQNKHVCKKFETNLLFWTQLLPGLPGVCQHYAVQWPPILKNAQWRFSQTKTYHRCGQVPDQYCWSLWEDKQGRRWIGRLFLLEMKWWSNCQIIPDMKTKLNYSCQKSS